MKSTYKKIFIAYLLFTAFSAKSQPSFHKLFISTGQPQYLTMVTATDEDAVIAYHYQTGLSTSLNIQRVNTSGNIIWAQAIQVFNNSLIPVNMCATPDSGAIVALEDSVLFNSIELIKINKIGVIDWAKSFNANYAALSTVPMLALPDGNVLLTYSSQDSFLLKKIDITGSLIWEQGYSTAGTSIIRPGGIAFTNSEIYIGGYDINSYSGFLIKTDSSGNILWQKIHVGDIGVSLNVIPVSSGSVLISTKSTDLSGNGQPVKLALIDSGGTIIWTKKFFMTDAKIVNLTSNKFGIFSFENAGIKLVIIDSTGLVQQVKSYHDGVITNIFSASSITDKGLLLSSINNNSIWLMKADTVGNTGCFVQSDTAGIVSDSFIPVNYTLVSNNIVSVFSSPAYINQNLGLIDSNLCNTASVLLLSEDNNDVIIFPNPVNTYLHINTKSNLFSQIEIFDSIGKKILSKELFENGIDISSFPKGIYFIKFFDIINTYTKKFIVQ